MGVRWAISLTMASWKSFREDDATANCRKWVRSASPSAELRSDMSFFYHEPSEGIIRLQQCVQQSTADIAGAGRLGKAAAVARHHLDNLVREEPRT